MDPWTGNLFGEGGVEKDLHTYPAMTAQGVHGGVIMAKLGNATAKYVQRFRDLFRPLQSCRLANNAQLVLYRAELGRATWKLL